MTIEQQKLSELEEQLHKAAGVHRKLLKLSRVKQKALVQLQFDKLRKVVKAEEKVLEKIRKVEERRITMSIRIAEMLDLDPEEVGLKEIIDEAPEPQAQKLSEIRDELRSIMKEIQEINQLNEKLGQQGVEQTEQILKVLMNGGEKEGSRAVYSARGEKNQLKSFRQGFVDHKV